MPPTADQILVRFGNTAMRRCGRIWMRQDKLDGIGAPTIVRADGTPRATYLDRNGILQVAAADKLRRDYTPYFGFGLVDIDGNPLAGTPIESASTNTLLQSQALATTWAANVLTATNNVAVAPDGTVTATGLVPTAVSSASHRVSQAVTITAGEKLAFSMRIKANGYNAVRVQVVDTATNVVGFILRFDASTGLFGANTFGGTGTLLGVGVPVLANGYWHFSGSGTIGGAVTAVTVFIDVFNTIANANTNAAYVGDAVSGVLAWGAQLERGAYAASSYIKTTTVPVTRAGDGVSMPVGFGPDDITTLVRMLRPTWADAVGNIGKFPGAFSLSTAISRLRMNADNVSRGFYANPDTPSASPSSFVNMPVGTALLAFCAQWRLLTTAGKAKIDAGTGFAAESGAATGFTSYGNQTLLIGSVGDELNGILLDLLIARGLWSYAEMVAAL